MELYKRKKYYLALDRSKSKIISSIDDDGKLHEILDGPVLNQGTWLTEFVPRGTLQFSIYTCILITIYYIITYLHTYLVTHI